MRFELHCRLQDAFDGRKTIVVSGTDGRVARDCGPWFKRARRLCQLANRQWQNTILRITDRPKVIVSGDSSSSSSRSAPDQGSSCAGEVLLKCSLDGLYVENLSYFGSMCTI